MLQDGQEDHGGDACGEAAVVEHKAAVEGAGGCTHGGAHETGGQPGADTVASYGTGLWQRLRR